METSRIILLVLIVSLLLFLFELAFRRCLLLSTSLFGDAIIFHFMYREEGGGGRGRHLKKLIKFVRGCLKRAT